MKRILLPLLSLVVVSHCSSALAQGLVGAPTDCLRHLFQPPPLLDGKTDKERWSKFLAMQPTLIGKTYDQVTKVFGYGKHIRDQGPQPDSFPSYVSYALTAKDYGRHKVGDIATTEVTLTIDKNGMVQAYKVEAVYWGN